MNHQPKNHSLIRSFAHSLIEKNNVLSLPVNKADMQSDIPSFFKLSLVIPCFNEADRLHYLREALAEFDAKWPGDYEVVIVDDGSEDQTLEALRELRAEAALTKGDLRTVALAENKGKGAALKSGLAVTSGDWVLTLDADMSTAPVQLLKWMKAYGVPESNTVYIGSRVHQDTQLKARPHRVVLGNLFNLAIRFITGIEQGDTQCGFKLYPAALAKEIFGELVEKGWAHDIELLMRLRQRSIRVVDLPVDWQHRPGGSISVLFDGIKMLLRLPVIRRRMRRSWK